ncbi:gag-pol fusion protein-like protein, partial [Leptotrombidium deliense]
MNAVKLTLSEYLGRVSVTLTIGLHKQKVLLYVLRNANQKLLLGLDLMREFKLKINDDFRIFQKVDLNNEIFEDEIISNYTQNANSVKHEKLNATVNSTETIAREECDTTSNSNECNENNLSESEKQTVNELINEFNDVSSKDKYDIGTINIEQCRVELTTKVPINLRPYRCSPDDQKLIDEQVAQLLKHNLIRKSVSSYGFPVTLADKKDEGKKTRFCCDLRKLNEVTVPEHYPFNRVDDIIDKLHECGYFTTLDISSGFWHLRVDKKDVHKLAFVTINNHYEWLVMPFGFRNAPAIFQRVIHNLLQKYDCLIFATNYLDDILIFSRTFEEHVKHVKIVLDALRKEN